PSTSRRAGASLSAWVVDWGCPTFFLAWQQGRCSRDFLSQLLRGTPVALALPPCPTAPNLRNPKDPFAIADPGGVRASAVRRPTELRERSASSPPAARARDARPFFPPGVVPAGRAPAGRVPVRPRPEVSGPGMAVSAGAAGPQTQREGLHQGD